LDEKGKLSEEFISLSFVILTVLLIEFSSAKILTHSLDNPFLKV
jgi:hypothetical protein